jgi:UbiD family decarboxylase
MLHMQRVPEGAALEKFRLRAFVGRLIEIGEVEVREDSIALSELSAAIAATPKALLFKDAGPEHHEIVAAVCGSRCRLGAAFGVDERTVAHEYLRRLGNPQPVLEIASHEAPVHQVVHTGEEVDLTKLPFHLQHEYDGGSTSPPRSTTRSIRRLASATSVAAA